MTPSILARLDELEKIKDLTTELEDVTKQLQALNTRITQVKEAVVNIYGQLFEPTKPDYQLRKDLFLYFS